MKKAPFGLQVAVICGVLAVAGAMFYRIAHLPQEDRNTVPKIARIMDVPVANVPVTTAAPRGALVLTSRFKAEADFTADATQANENWTSGYVGGKRAWQDNQSGMIWGPRLDMTFNGFGTEDLKKTKEACAAETPAGVWSLPTAAEFDIAKVNGILKADSDARHRWVGYTYITGVELPAGRGYVPISVEKDFSVRCVARSSKAPQDGYLQAGNEITLKAMSE